MKLVVLCVALATGCYSMGPRMGVNASTGDASVRRVTGAFEAGAALPLRRLLATAYMAGGVGPLGDNSEAVLEYGARVIVPLPGRWLAPYARFSYGTGCKDEKPDVCGDVFSGSLGLGALKMLAAPGTFGKHTTLGWGVVTLGLAYHHHTQDEIMGGSFVGLELSTSFGIDALRGIIDVMREEKN